MSHFAAALSSRALAFALAFGCWQAHRTLLLRPPAPLQAKNVTTVPLVTWRRMALTYRAAVADTFYLRAVNAFGSKAEHRRHYPTLAPLLWRSSHIDPKFAAPYLLAGTALTLTGADQAAALALLQRGAAHRPDVWRIPFLLGFELFSGGDVRAAAQAMATASRAPEAPAFVGGLAVRLAAESGDAALGLAMLNALDRSVAAAMPPGWQRERRQALEYQHALATWQTRVDAFARTHGRLPHSLTEVTDGEHPMAHDPWGAPLALDAQGQVMSANTARLLRVHRDPYERAP